MLVALLCSQLQHAHGCSLRERADYSWARVSLKLQTQPPGRLRVQVRLLEPDEAERGLQLWSPDGLRKVRASTKP